jgi:hypothetical protein
VFAASPRGQRNSGFDRAMTSLDEQHFRTALARFLVPDRGNDLPLTSQQPRFARPRLGVGKKLVTELRVPRFAPDHRAQTMPAQTAGSPLGLGVLSVMAIFRQPQIRPLDNDCRAPRELENQNRSSGPTTTSP